MSAHMAAKVGYDDVEVGTQLPAQTFPSAPLRRSGCRT